jgi:tetratricopeptide (TPR) repeat protein
MRTLSALAARCALVVVVVTAAGCSQIGVLKGRLAFKDANTSYSVQDYKAAAAKYEEALQADPTLVTAYFYLGNSYDNQYRGAKRGDPANDALIAKAIENYKKSSELETDPKIKRLAMQYLVSAYGPDKLNDPEQQVPVLKRMIELDPTDTANYFVLAGVYEQSGELELAEELLVEARDVKPGDSATYLTLARFYNNQGQFDKTMEALHARADKEPNNPEAHYTIATYYWEKAYKDFTISQADKVKFVQEGLKAVDKAVELKPDYHQALEYKNLLLRSQALVEKSPARQQELLRQARQFQERAADIREKQRAAGNTQKTSGRGT